MSVVSNRYATRAFSEHPIALWPIDDEVYFLSKISSADQILTTWDTDKCSVTTSEIFSILDPTPFKNETNYYVVGDHTQITSNTNIEIFKQDVFQLDSLDENMKTFCINFYVYQDSSYAQYYEFGYRYLNSQALLEEEISFKVLAPGQKQWINLQNTFDVSQFDSETVEIFIRVNVDSGGTTNDYNFVVNGLSVGQWSESFCSKNLGIFSESLPIDTDLTTVTGVQSEQYGPLSDNAYYIVESGKLLAKNNSMPMVYGSENSTSLYPSSSSSPSFIFPGKGMLSEKGRYSSFTLEFWLRVKPNTKQQRRILGSLDSDYGVYVSEGFISLVFGNQIKSHNIQNWYRPMLVHLTYSSSRISLIINGDQVIEITLDQSDLIFSKDNEWIGFYSYDDIDIFQIDCISIYPYELPITVAKRRLVWGQGVFSEETIDSSFRGKTASINFPNANYAVNAVYPDKERWDAGSFNNLLVNQNYIDMPNYSLPNIFLSGRDVNIWYQDNKKVNDLEYVETHPNFVTFRPNLNEDETQWIASGPNWNEKCYFQFSSANVLGSPFSALFGIFEVEEDIELNRPLIHIVNALNGKRFEININSYTLSYIYNGEELFSADTSGQEHIVAGLHIPTIAQNFGYDLASFFASYENLEIYIGGAPDYSAIQYETFEGKIYKVSFSDSDNYDLISNHFDSNGFANYQQEDLLYHYATYTLSAFEKYGRFFLDISVSSYWEEYIPLIYFAKYITLNGSADYYDFDFLQFNIGYPSYIEKNLINVPEDTYEEIYNNQIKLKEIDLSKSSAQIFATFQLLAEGANEPIENFPYTKQLTNTYTIDAASENTTLDPYKAYKTKFSIKDGTIIYPPKNISIEDVAIVLHIKINHDCILTNPIKIRNLEISSKALDRNSYNPISTKFGKNIYSYTKTGIYFNYKNRNSYLIGKDNLPYLYLSDNSGMQIVQRRSLGTEHAISIPINEFKEENYNLAAVQFFMKNNIEDILDIAIPIFELNSSNQSISFFIDSDESQERYRIFALDKISGQEYGNIIFYKNGILCENLYVEKEEWNTISILLPTSLSLSSYTGSINFYSGITFDNVSCYVTQGLDEISSVVPKIWSDILSNGVGNNFSWSYWYGTTGENIIDNPSFGTNIDNYSSPQTLSLNTDILYSYEGDNSASITISNTSDTELISVNSGTAVESGQSYLVTAKFYIPSESPLAGKTITISGEGGSGYTNSTSGLVSPTLIAGSWVTAQRRISMSTSTMPKISAELNNTTGASGATIYSDNWKIEKIISQQQINKWSDVYVDSFDRQYSLTPEDIFSSYVGSNNSIIDDGFGITVSNDLFRSFSEISWSSFTSKPA